MSKPGQFLMSPDSIHTAELNGVASFDYLVALLRNPEAVRTDPGMWMPWNYPRPA